MIMAEIYEHTIHLFLRECGGSALKKGIYYLLGSDADSKRRIEEKLRVWSVLGSSL